MTRTEIATLLNSLAIIILAYSTYINQVDIQSLEGVTESRCTTLGDCQLVDELLRNN